jgi:hypothetical protein
MSLVKNERHAELADFYLFQARQYNSQNNYLRAFPHYLMFAQLEKQKFKEEEHVTEFLIITHALVTKVEQQGKKDKVEH